MEKREGLVRTAVGFTLYIPNEDIDDINKIVDSIEKSGLLIDDVSETVKHEIKKTRRWILFCYDGTYGCFIDNTYGFFTDTTGGFSIDKCYNRKSNHDSRKKKKKLDFFHYYHYL